MRGFGGDCVLPDVLVVLRLELRLMLDCDNKGK